jgi:hypothetical protein
MVLMAGTRSLGALLIGTLLIKQRGVAALGAGKRRPETEAVGEVTESSTNKQHTLSYTVRPIAALLDGWHCISNTLATHSNMCCYVLLMCC